MCSCFHITSGDDAVYSGDKSASSLVVPPVSAARHSTVQEPLADESPGSRPDLDDDASDVEDEVITKLVRNETMKEGACVLCRHRG